MADEVAAAADLVKGKASRVPAALLRGVPRPKGDGTARDLVRPPTEDLFRTAGTAEDLLAFLEGPAAPTGAAAAVDPATLGEALASARAVPIPGGRRLQVVPVPGTPELLACCLGPPADPAEVPAGVELAAGGAVRTLVLGLHALGVVAVFQPAGAGAAAGAGRGARPRPRLGAPWAAGGRSAPLAAARRAALALGGQAAVAVAVEEVDDRGRWPSRPGTATRSGCRG